MAGKQWQIFGALFGIFLVAYYLPLANPRVEAVIIEAFMICFTQHGTFAGSE